jgi:hypothetical protein
VLTALFTVVYLSMWSANSPVLEIVTALGSSFDHRTSYIVLDTSWYFYLFLALRYNGDSTVPNLPDSVTCISILACSLVRVYSELSIYRFSRKWRKQTMNVRKRKIRKATFCLTKKVLHCLLLHGRILPQLKM